MQKTNNGFSTDIVLLAAGLSLRMGSINKMLLPVNGLPMCVHCALQALDFLKTAKGKLIIVTGYNSREIKKALLNEKSLRDLNEEKLIITENKDFQNGQFSSTKTGTARVQDGSCFFISLADMPAITANHYRKLVEILIETQNKSQNTVDAVRPFYKDLPGHPVLHVPKLKEEILKMPDEASVRELLSKFKTLNVQMDERSWVEDIDTYSEYLAQNP